MTIIRHGRDRLTSIAAAGHPHDCPRGVGSGRCRGLRRLRRMARSVLERRLSELSDRMKQLRVDLAVAEEQLAHFADEADDARLRALVAETPLAEQEHREAEKHADGDAPSPGGPAGRDQPAGARAGRPARPPDGRPVLTGEGA